MVETGRSVEVNEQTVIEYFERIRSGDLDGLLNLFSENAVIHQPFSKLSIIGKSQIEMFLRTVIMANTGMQTGLEFVRKENRDNQLIVLVTFVKSASLKGKFTFEFDTRKKSTIEERINTLTIEFIE